MSDIPDLGYEIIFIDNASTDETVSKLRALAALNPCVKVILNTRNFGHIRSPYYGLLQAYGDAVIMMASDLQDPPLLIKDFIQKWQEGYKVVLGIKTRSQETKIFYFFRSFYYKVLAKLTDVQLIEHFTGFGLYDQKVIEIIQKNRRSLSLFSRINRRYRFSHCQNRI